MFYSCNDVGVKLKICAYSFSYGEAYVDNPSECSSNSQPSCVHPIVPDTELP